MRSFFLPRVIKTSADTFLSNSQCSVLPTNWLRCHRIGQASSVNVMYCICKDEDVSCDVSLWSMLARKVGNLGKVVDGERGQLNAVEKDNGTSTECQKKQSGARNGNGTSVEDELTSFFASANVAKCVKQKKGPIVKGTIQSFFMMQAKKSESSMNATLADEAMTASTPNVAACISLIDEVDDEQEYISAPRSIDKDNAPKPACSRQMSLLRSGQTSNIRSRQRSLMPASPHSRPAPAWPKPTCSFEHSDPILSLWSCTVCTYKNHRETTCCEMCGTTKYLDLTKRGRMLEVDTNESYESTRKVHDFESDEEWNQQDLVAIDLITPSHSKSIQFSSPGDSHGDGPSTSCLLDSPTEILSFAVSLNSGRIALYLSSTGQPLNVNFDVSQVLTEKSADDLEESHLLRKVPDSTISKSQQNISFDDGIVKQVLAAVDDDTLILSHRENLHVMCEELKQFVRCYLSLREIEKKVVRESGQAFTTSSLKQTVAKLLVSTITGTTERYQGGAKEKAAENMKHGCATAIDMAVINGEACAWCAKPFFFVNGATYCTQSCAEEGRVRRGGMYSSTKIREQLFALEHGICTKVRG